VRIGYVPYSRDLTQPGDRRRFPYYAEKRGIEFELADLTTRYDLVVVTPRADLEAWRRYRPGTTKVVFDIVDAYLSIPRTNPKAALRGAAKFAAGEARHPFFSYRRALEDILLRADAATCASPEQAAVIAPLCRNVHPILDFQSGLVTRVKADYAAASPFNLVWEGLGENARWIERISGALRTIDAQHPLVLNLVTAREFHQIGQRFWRRETKKIVSRYFDRVRVHQWSEESLAPVAAGCDVAVIPLPLDRPLEAGKPESKLVSFWRMGLPTVASSTLAYRRVMESAGQHLHCGTEEEWVKALQTLIVDRGARKRAGEGGREFAETEYGEERLLAAWDRVFDGI
jgi:hypothetical protein